MNKYYKIFILTFLIVFIHFSLLFYVPTPNALEHYKLTEKERLEVIEKLRVKCTFEDAIVLAINYKDILNDKRTAQCWSEYANECVKRKENNESLKINIICPSY